MEEGGDKAVLACLRGFFGLNSVAALLREGGGAESNSEALSTTMGFSMRSLIRSAMLPQSVSSP